MKLDEQFEDIRSREVAYKLTIDNTLITSLTILTLKPRLPVGARLVDVIDNSMVQAGQRRDQLVHELNILLLQRFSEMPAFQEKQKQVRRTAERVARSSSNPPTSGARNIWDRYASVMKGLLTGIGGEVFDLSDDRDDDSLAGALFKIESSEDADLALKKWFTPSAPEQSPPNDEDTLRSIFEAKIDQLRRVEAKVTETDSTGLTTIEPGSSFVRTYVVKFRRPALEPRKYQLGFEGEYEAGEAQRTISVATHLQISPYPLSLNLVVIVAALLGAFVREALSDISNPLQETFLQANNGKLFVGPIVALVFFNAYEYTSLGKGLTMAVSWRSALLIGTLCGLADDRIVSALKALIGV
ncbi:hypothetical protein [Mycobacterium sp. 1274761.0]|uniref:hypothetical protein n=1 Tax=Mycobacterium sp. 1274761.0 TaxID=1834077 RepID=UPI0012E80F48|nr:hypothetical protein [Mycobacterium sp. 1274761.0]